KAMRRPANQEKVLERIGKWRKQCPDLTLRSTFIVGFPGESDEDFAFLLDWLKEAQLDRVGCFRYENVAEADSDRIAGHVAKEAIEERWNRYMQVQQEISAGRLKNKIGKTMPVLIDDIADKKIVGRSHADAPEIDGVVHVQTDKRVLPGQIVQVRINASD